MLELISFNKIPPSCLRGQEGGIKADIIQFTLPYLAIERHLFALIPYTFHAFYGIPTHYWPPKMLFYAYYF